MTVAVLSPGCATTRKGLQRDEVICQAANNAVAKADFVIKYPLAPAASVGELVLGIDAAARAAWNTHRHSHITNLEKANGDGKPKTPPPAKPPPAPQPG